MQINKYYASALTAFIMWGFFSLALKPLHDYPSIDILFYRVIFATVILLALNFIFRKGIVQNDLSVFRQMGGKQKMTTLSLTILGGVLLVVNWLLFIYAMNHVSLKSASFAYLICPIVTTILAYFILKENLTRWQWFSVALCAISCGILSYGNLTELFYSLTIAVSFALYLISQRKNNVFDNFLVLTVQMVFASVVMLPFFPQYAGPVPTESLFYILLLVIVVFFTIIPLFLNLFALKGMNSSAVGILMYTNPLINFLLAIFYFHEPINLTQLVSYGLILLSIVIFNEKFLFGKAVDNKFK